MKSPELVFEEAVRRAVTEEQARPNLWARFVAIREALARLDADRDDLERGEAYERIERQTEVPWGES